MFENRGDCHTRKADWFAMTFLIWEHRLHNRLLPPILNFRNVFICFTQLPGKLTETVRWTAFRRAGYGSTLVQIDRHAIPFPRAGDSTPGSGRRLFSLFLLVITQVIQRICHLVHRVLTLFTTIGKIVTEFPGRIKENFTKEIEVCLRR